MRLVVNSLLFLSVLFGTTIAFSNTNVNKKFKSISSISLNAEATSPIDSVVEGLKGLFQNKGPASTADNSKNKELITKCDNAINLLTDAANTKAEDEDSVVQALLDLESGYRILSKEVGSTISSDTLKNLNGSWRLIFTTGTKETQKKLGGRRISYFPIKAVQSFNTETMKLTNGIYLGDFAVVKFFGPFEWIMNKRKLEFDFTRIELFNGNLGFDLKAGEAASIGSKTGLGSSNNEKLIENKKKPFFNWISADDNIATARGGGGGLALWKKE